MKQPTQMTIDELNLDVQQHLLDLAAALHTRNNLIAATVMAKEFELSPNSATPNVLNDFVQFATNFLSSESMKKIGLLLNPTEKKVKLTAKIFAGIGDIIIEKKLELDSQIIKLSHQLSNLQSELDFRTKTAIILQEREYEISSKKPYSFKLRFWVAVRKILNRLSPNKYNNLALKVESAITKLLPIIQIPEVNNDDPSLESVADIAEDNSEIKVEVVPAAPKLALDILKGLKMPKEKIARDDNTKDAIETQVDDEKSSTSEVLDQPVKMMHPVVKSLSDKHEDGFEEWDKAVFILPKAKENGIKNLFRFFNNGKKGSAIDANSVMLGNEDSEYSL